VKRYVPGAISSSVGRPIRPREMAGPRLSQGPVATEAAPTGAAYAAVMRSQAAFLAEQARGKGFRDVDELADPDLGGFVAAAIQWAAVMGTLPSMTVGSRAWHEPASRPNG
jgi:hypothetical protein